MVFPQTKYLLITNNWNGSDPAISICKINLKVAKEDGQLHWVLKFENSTPRLEKMFYNKWRLTKKKSLFSIRIENKMGYVADGADKDWERETFEH